MNALTQEQVIKRINLHYENKVKLLSTYKNRRTAIELECLECGHQWFVMPQNILYSTTKGRCPKCLFRNYQVLITNCAYCGKIIRRIESEIKDNKSGLFYCSRVCGNLHKNQIRKDNGEWDDSKNYRLNAFNTYKHQCAICGWNEDERILEVHHIDENHNNNNINNLCILCPTCHRKITLGYYKMINFTLVKLK